jgi:sorbitol-specific phosphotransferase system component IIBC
MRIVIKFDGNVGQLIQSTGTQTTSASVMIEPARAADPAYREARNKAAREYAAQNRDAYNKAARERRATPEYKKRRRLQELLLQTFKQAAGHAVRRFYHCGRKSRAIIVQFVFPFVVLKNVCQRVQITT